MKNIFISPNASIGEGVVLGNNIRIWNKSIVGYNTIIEDNVQIGHPSPEEYSRVFKKPYVKDISTIDAIDKYVCEPTTIGNNSIIRSNSIIYSGCKIGNYFDCGHNICIRENCTIGNYCYITVNTIIMKHVVVGNNSKLGGTICDRCRIGDNVTTLGNLMHTYKVGESGHIELAPELKSCVVVGRNVSVIGGITLGKGCFIGAGSIVTTDTPEFALVSRTKSNILKNKSPIKNKFLS